jgi:uncharacterized protein (DUF885 family)
MSAVAAIADELHEAVLDHFPVSASVRGFRGRDDNLTDHSEDAEAAFAAALVGIADRAERLPAAELSETDRITRTMIIQQIRTFLDRIDGRWIEFTVSDLILTTVPGLLLDLATVPVTTARQGEDYLTRLSRLPAFFDTMAQRHRAGIAVARLPVAHLVHNAIDHLDRQLATVADLRRHPADASEDFLSRCRSVVTDLVAPAIRRYRDILARDVLPHGRDADHAGLCWLPDGRQLYATAVREHTTTDLTPEQLHQVGLDVIASLAREYVEIGSRVFGTHDLQEVFARLRDDPDLRYRDGTQMLRSAKDTVLRAEGAAAPWFRTLPSSACVVAAYPAAAAPRTPSAYLVGSMDGIRPGTYFVNTARPSDTVRYLAEVTAFHEGVPGHHFEMTTRQERTDLPLLRRTADLSAFCEGWALYAERLADEMGLYSSDLDRLGMLVFDSTRAGRLVVDTGLHAKGWSRRQGIDYLSANTPMALEHIVSEVDRYLADPGQALAYMVGRLEIQRLRRHAEQALGDRFDIADFHEAILVHGRVPLSTLAELVANWITVRRVRAT